MDTQTIAEFVSSKTFLVIIGVVLGVGLLFGSFSIGMAVGFHKARVSYAWGESYNRVFAGPRGGFMDDMMRDGRGRDYIDANGVFGQVIKIDGQTLVIGGRDSLERVVTIVPETSIRLLRDDVTLQDVHVGDSVVVVGTPDADGKIEAQLIRIMPQPTNMMAPTDVPLR